MKTKKTIKAKIHVYNFDIREASQKKAYEKEFATAQQLSKQKEPDTLHYINFCTEKGKNDLREFYNKLKTLEYVNIETEFLFSNQFNTREGFRAWFWRENIFENKYIKQGYYIETPTEFLKLLDDTFKCGYCGEQYYKPKQNFCNACLESEFLTKEYLPLLQLKPVSSDGNIFYNISENEMANLIKKWEIAQQKGNKKRVLEKIKADKERIKKHIKEHEKESKALKWVLKNKLDWEFINNMIYYSHTGLFSFGWRNKLSFEKEQILKEKLKGFPFDYEIKV